MFLTAYQERSILNIILMSKSAVVVATLAMFSKGILSKFRYDLTEYLTRPKLAGVLQRLWTSWL